MEVNTSPLSQIQLELETTFSKNQLMKRIREFFTEFEHEGFTFIQYLRDNEIPEEFGIDFLCQIYLHKRTNISTMVGVLLKHTEDNNAQLVADLIYKCIDIDLADYNGVSQTIIVKHHIPKEVQEEIDLFQFPIPLVVTPKKVTHNGSYGYHTFNGSVLLGGVYHTKDVNLDVLNTMNEVPLALNKDVISKIKNHWKDIDAPKKGETSEEYSKRRDAFDKYNKDSKRVMDMMIGISDKFYMVHRPDKRGRIFCSGYHINYQGNDYNKACVEFYEKELLDGDIC